MTSMLSPGTATAQVILEAARDEIAETGTLTVKGTARRAGVSRQAIHYHYGGARGLRAALRAGSEAAAAGATDIVADDLPTRERLLAAAERLLGQPAGGLVTIEAIAAEASLTKGAVYHHFADRADLLRAVAQRISPVGELRDALAQVGDLSVRDGLVVLARTYYAAIRSRADIMRHLAANAGRDVELGQVVMAEVIGQGAPVILGWLVNRIESGELRAIHPSLIVQALFGPAFLRIVLGGPLFESLTALGVQPATEVPEAYVDLLLAGIAGPSGAGASHRSTPTGA